MASLRKRGDRYFVDYYFHGRRVRKSVGTSKRVALDVLKDIQGRQVRDDVGLAVRDLSCEQALDEFLEDRRARNTLLWTKHQERILKDLISWSRVKRLRQLTPRIVARWQLKRAEETSSTTARGNVGTVRAWMRWAKRFGYLQVDPTDQVQRLPPPPRREVRFLTKDEAERLLEACREGVPLRGPGKKGKDTSRERRTPLYEMVAVALYAGLRLGEILHLRREDVELETNGGLIGVRVSDAFLPKDREGRRIPLHSRLRGVLLSSLERSEIPEGLLFPSLNGTPIDTSNAQRELRLATQRAEIDGRCNWNILRHTFASWLTMKGVSLHKISRFLGHSSVTTTEKHYAGLVPETLHEDIEKLGS